MKISVVVLTFNSQEYLPDLFESLEQTEWDSFEHEIIYVDNGSQDDTVKIVSDNLRDNSYLVCMEENLGYAGGNNVGIRQALGSNSDYIVLLNDDTVVEPNWIQEMLKVMDEKENSGAVQSLLLYWDQKDTINSAGNHLHYLGFGYAGGNLQKSNSHPEFSSGSNSESSQTLKQVQGDCKEITYASGAAVMYRAEALNKIGILDQVLESYHEDADMGMRLRLAGYESYLATKSIVYHKYSFIGSRKTMPGSYKYYLMERNRVYFLLKFYGLEMLLLILPVWLVMEAGVMAFAIMRGFWKEKLKAYGWIVSNMKLILSKRREIKILKKIKGISDRDLMYDFVGEINFQEINNPILKYIGNPIIKIYWVLIKKLI